MCGHSLTVLCRFHHTTPVIVFAFVHHLAAKIIACTCDISKSWEAAPLDQTPLILYSLVTEARIFFVSFLSYLNRLLIHFCHTAYSSHRLSSHNLDILNYKARRSNKSTKSLRHWSGTTQLYKSSNMSKFK
jgi:hypothetical protein